MTSLYPTNRVRSLVKTSATRINTRFLHEGFTPHGLETYSFGDPQRAIGGVPTFAPWESPKSIHVRDRIRSPAGLNPEFAAGSRKASAERHARRYWPASQSQILRIMQPARKHSPAAAHYLACAENSMDGLDPPLPVNRQVSGHQSHMDRCGVHSARATGPVRAATVEATLQLTVRSAKLRHSGTARPAFPFGRPQNIESRTRVA